MKIPQAIPVRPARQTQANVPPTKALRDQLRREVQRYVAEHKLVPPVPFEELRGHADVIVHDSPNEAYRDFTAVLLNNECWRDILAGIPFERRLLLMPVCLRDEAQCKAPFDEFGLLCKECGKCSLHDFKTEAERLGYAVLIAEGTPIVRQLIETGKIDAVIGISCLNVLERVFPYMETMAIPGIAVPLLQDDCHDTNIDVDGMWDILHLTGADRAYRMNLDEMRRHVDEWFSAESLAGLMIGDADDPTTRIGREWMGRAGKRWRPFLTACIYKACRDSIDEPMPAELRKAAVAVECFHKASLIHDDIEDEDAVRYGEKTLHEEYSVPMALNVGDYLIGEGYRLLAECSVAPETRAAMLRVAAHGHRSLSIGQGAELNWAHDPQPMKARQVLSIFSQKTAPAFEVALRVGAILGGASPAAQDLMGEYSESLGIAYQISDDLDDIFGSLDSNDARDMRPSLLLALAYEKSSGADRNLLDALWRKKVDFADVETDVRRVLVDLKIEERVRELLRAYQEEAVRVLRRLENPTMKGLLRRVLGKIFDAPIVEATCRELLPRNAAGGEALADAAG